MLMCVVRVAPSAPGKGGSVRVVLCRTTRSTRRGGRALLSCGLALQSRTSDGGQRQQMLLIMFTGSFSGEYCDSLKKKMTWQSPPTAITKNKMRSSRTSQSLWGDEASVHGSDSTG